MGISAYLVRTATKIDVLSPYNEGFKQDVKEIPYHARSWDADQRCWVVDVSYADLLEEIASRYYDVIWLISESESERRVNAAKASTQRQQGGSSSHSTAQCLAVISRVYEEEAILGIFPPAESERIIRAAYRARAPKVHPDHAGAASHGAMVALNRAYDTLLKRCKRAAS